MNRKLIQSIFSIFLLITLLIGAAILPVSAADAQYPNAMALYQAWHSDVAEDESPYPEYVCGMWSVDGSENNLMIALTDDAAGEAGRAEILTMVANTSSLSFTTMKYSHAELQRVRNAMMEQLTGQATGGWGMGIHEMENCVSVTINPELGENAALISAITQQYGDKVKIQAGELVLVHDLVGDVFFAPIEKDAFNSAPNSLLICLILCACLLLTVSTFLLVRRKVASHAKVTADGTVCTEQKNKPLTLAQQIKEETVEPPLDTLASIKQKIEEQTEK